ncbi:MAG: SDR family NAD(P)-dependent oxidoreductase [bacterium]
MMEIINLKDRIALVTGASRGIGRATALALAKAGAHVIAMGRTQGGLEELDDDIKAIGGTASLIVADINNREEIKQLGPALLQRFGKLDIYIANAGLLGELAPVADIDPKRWDLTINTNLTAQWYLLAQLDPLLRQSDAARVLFLTTGTTTSYRAYWSAYTVSKAGLEALGRTYANEMKNTNLRVALINPGATRTDMRAQAMPGEDPNTLPPASAIAEQMLKFVEPDYDGLADRINIADMIDG